MTPKRTGMSRLVSLPVDGEGERPGPSMIRAARVSLGRGTLYEGELLEKWLDVKGKGFSKDWMYCIGIPLEQKEHTS